ncbi:DUF4253 domain-containing protein [Streptomyces poonensis]|uniref:DUF4253 domain-containing protein n=1 Tax=Streptomyces poonensis TaxID=68255 RepID=A0A918PLL5_9ACTN|nr:DUF4253 domain-containing protein [Streptomyces poonensis]GGZ15201.1 hypothetical protein GCM10010365_38610 [Streptomyces poonensis]GLJ91464.1 hypothetical protein GCM10017589_40710 [Streptomyces poonensis]
MATLPNPLPRLAADPSGRSLGLALPLGRLIDATAEGPWHEPLLWHGAYDAAPGAWTALGSPAARVGLLPVLVQTGDCQDALDKWGLRPALMSYPGDHDAEEVLAEFWEGEEIAEWDTAGDVLAPFGPDWPGPAPAGTLTADPAVRAAEVADSLLADGSLPTHGSYLEEMRLALVPARRSADIPAAIGWTGPLNHENDVARLGAVLRSWEDRFGIRVVALTPDQLVVSVAAPPTTTSDAEALAAEHFAFCPDNITQGEHDTLRTYAAEEVLGQRMWSFWWD